MSPPSLQAAIPVAIRCGAGTVQVGARLAHQAIFVEFTYPSDKKVTIGALAFAGVNPLPFNELRTGPQPLACLAIGLQQRHQHAVDHVRTAAMSGLCAARVNPACQEPQ